MDSNRAALISAILMKKNIKLLLEYANYAHVFSPKKTIKLSEHHFDNHKIILKESKILLQEINYSL